MKKLNNFCLLAFGLLVAVLFTLSSCSKMDDIQRKYAEKAEQVYLGKVDSVRSFPGFSRAKLTWYISSDPKIERTIIYWNLRKDSIIKVFERKSSGLQRDSIIIDNLPEGTTLFEFRNVNSAGETSLFSSASASVWGSKFADGLHARKIKEFDFNYPQSLFNLQLSPSFIGDSVIYSRIIYKNVQGMEKTIRIDRDSLNVKLVDFPDGGEFRFQTIFFPPQGIDTVYNEAAIFKAPKAATERGTKLSLKGNMSSKYFERSGKNLYEWNASGDLIVYVVNVDGSLAKTVTLPAIVPRATYRDFFFYNDDKFIGISKANAVSMHQVEDGQLNFVKTPAGANTFGAGFTYQDFIPAAGYFISVAAITGELKTWVALNNATWGTPNGSIVGTGFSKYNKLILFNNRALLGVDAEGYLWSIQTSVSGTIGSKSRIGSSWGRFKKMISVGTTLYCMEENGDFYVFNNFNITDKFWIVD